MHLHSVYFWLKAGTSEDQRRSFEQGLASLRDISTVQACYIGSAIPSDRPVVDDTFSYGLHCLFRTSADHDAYQVDPLHDAFVENFKALWEKVMVYDTRAE